VSNTRIAGTQINLPGETPTRTAEALAKAAKLAADKSEAFRARDAADTALRKAKAAEPDRQARSYVYDDKPAGGKSPVEAAEKAAVAAQARLTMLIAAEPLMLAEVRKAVAADREGWQASAIATADAGILRLATAVAMAEQARAELHSSIGILNMFALHEENGGGPLSIMHGRGSHTFQIGAGIESLREAVAAASTELQAVKPDKRRKKAPAPTIEADTDGFDDDNDLAGGGDDD
jgi:hypothetical protein